MVPLATTISLRENRKKPLASIVRASSLAYCAMSRLTPRLRFIEPQLPSLVDQPPEGKHWIHEVKHDGYRSQVLVREEKPVSSPAMDTIGATAIRLSSAPLPRF